MKTKSSFLFLFLLISSTLWSSVGKEFDFKLIYGENIHGIFQNFPVCVGIEAKITPHKILYGKLEYKIFPNFSHILCGSLGIELSLMKEVSLFIEYGEAFYVLERFMTNFHSIISSGVEFDLSERFKLDFYYSRLGNRSNIDNFFVAFKYSFR
jgi:hypothetical protein